MPVMPPACSESGTLATRRDAIRRTRVSTNGGAFQIRANLVFPLSLKDRLWGLLCVHQCDATRHWEESELDLAKQLSTGLAIAIQQAELFERLQTELDQRHQAQKELSKRNEELQEASEKL